MKRAFYLFLVMLFVPIQTLAQEMKTFQQIPFWNGSGSASFIEALYTIAIAAAAILVVLRLIMAGVEYMFSEMITSKAKAKEKIQGALLGLLIILGAVTILSTINPRLTNLDVIGNGPAVTLKKQSRYGFQFEKGDTWSASEVAIRCTVDGDISGPCVERTELLLKESCVNSGGTYDWETDLNVDIDWWGTVGWSYYNYICE